MSSTSEIRPWGRHACLGALHCHHLRADVTRGAATGHPRPRALDPPARARIPRRAREPPTRGDNTCGGERGSVPLPVGLTNREPCPRVVRIAGNAFFSSKPRFDRGKIRLQCKVMTSNVIRTSVDEGVQPRERRSHPTERRSTSSDGVMGDPSGDQNDRKRTPPGNDCAILFLPTFPRKGFVIYGHGHGGSEGSGSDLRISRGVPRAFSAASWI